MAIDDGLLKARESFDRHAWNDAYVRLAVADEQGTLTIPALARALGVAPSALYHHVSGRDEIISLMREELALTTGGTDQDWTRPWEQALEAWARSYLAAFAAHPGAVPLLAGAPRAG